MYTTKTDRCSRRFGRRFSSEASRSLHAILFFNAGSDYWLRTSPSRGYCWGLDLRVKPSPSEVLPNSFVGPSKTKTFGDEGYRLRPAEGDERLPRSASSRAKTFGSEGYRLRPADGDERLLRSTSSKTRTFGDEDRLRSSLKETKAFAWSRRACKT